MSKLVIEKKDKTPQNKGGKTVVSCYVDADKHEFLRSRHINLSKLIRSAMEMAIEEIKKKERKEEKNEDSGLLEE